MLDININTISNLETIYLFPIIQLFLLNYYHFYIKVSIYNN